ncbi:hypothetical protein HNP46_000198 [Pseudomonas nitritireducens]|uniref:Uncharacterized protein n=1 Tax=Pseudomonas nitroreducens TaxID=46680 RepID=A0A7W7KEK0_PSENT|nr:hypothetical protein [Pseudomonas nitritireducens]MBB4861387.1 hypothetical protein [Pseudomonas nitritireducens]
MSTSNDEMIFSPEAQDAFWGAMSPDTRRVFEQLQARERWTHHYEENPALFTRLARALPEVVSIPLTQNIQEVLVSLIPLLTSMPLMQGVFAIYWLNHLTENQSIGWGTLCYLEALDIANNQPEHEHYEMSVAMVRRISAAMQVRSAMGLASNWPLKTR